MGRSLGDDLGKLILRLTLGVLMIMDGIHKLNHGIDGIKDMLAASGLPEAVAYGVYLGEVVAPLMVILGLFCRFGAFIMVVNMVFAIYLVHPHELMMLTETGGWQLELQGFFLLTALALVFMNPGRIALTRY